MEIENETNKIFKILKLNVKKIVIKKLLKNNKILDGYEEAVEKKKKELNI